ncbi:hypothetical protein C8R48DRAFT_222016 [Suillus tomentosus]|nr:hypothetical protein C8R48DRAFT_222016 [Suillus tomentosus]
MRWGLVNQILWCYVGGNATETGPTFCIIRIYIPLIGKYDRQDLSITRPINSNQVLILICKCRLSHVLGLMFNSGHRSSS